MVGEMVETYKKIVEVRKKLTEWFDKVSSAFSTEEVVLECMALRGYFSEELYNKLMSEKLFKVDNFTDANLICPMSEEDLKDCGLVLKSMFLLGGRYCLPIRDTVGRVMAIVGYYPCERKYVTTPAFGFFKATSFYGVHNASYYDEPFICLCEGIFDTLSLQAWGIPALGNQGLDLSCFKSEMLSRYKKVICIPDADNAGKSVNPYYARAVGKSDRIWRIPIDNVFIDLSPSGVKDIDDYLKNEEKARALKPTLLNTGRYLQRLT